MTGVIKSMKYPMTRRTEQGARANNSGFTLVELIVVLVLMMILLSLVIFGGLSWQDWSRFKHENTVAEDLFYAAQNQLTALRRMMAEHTVGIQSGIQLTKRLVRLPDNRIRIAKKKSVRFFALKQSRGSTMII